MITTQVGVVLGIVTVVGVTLAGFGYDLADQLFAYVGWLAGGVAGGVVGWFGVPLVTTVDLAPRVGVALGAVVVGGILGRLFFPLATRLGMTVAGFVVTAGATLAVFVGSELTRVFTSVDPADPAGSVEQVAALPVFESAAFTQTLLIAGVVGLLGAVLAARYYTVILTVAVTGLGAVLLGGVVPLWQAALSGSVTLGTGVSAVSPRTALAVFVVGLGVQFYRHGNRDRLPGVGDEPLR